MFGVQLGDDLLIADGVQIFQRQVLQFPLDALHAQPVRDGSIDFHSFQGFLLLFGRGLVFHGPHVVEPVRNFDENYPDVLTHGDEHFPEVLHLLVFLGGVLNPGQFADAFHQVGNGGREELADLLMGSGSVLNDIVEQSGHNGLGVQLQLLCHDLSHRQGVDDIGLAAFSLLPLMGFLGKFEGGVNLVEVRGGIVASDGLYQIFILFLNGHQRSPLGSPASLRSRER